MLPQLLGLGATSLDAEIDGFLLRAPSPSSTQVAEFLKLYAKGSNRDEAARMLVAKGVAQTAVSNALNWLDSSSSINWNMIYGIAATVSMATSAFHGYRRNQSIGWAIWWGIMGGVLPVFVPVLAIAQGFGQPAKKGA